MAPCPMSFVCWSGECDPLCQMGEFPCPGGFSAQTVNGQCLCVPDKRCDPPCAGGEYCDPKTGRCIDKCANVKCDPPLRCDQGVCYGCEHFGCANRCTRCDRASHQCVDDKCCNVTCDAGKTCDPETGRCVGTCPLGCPNGQICSEGTCVGDPCAKVHCPETQACDPASGKCTPNPCSGISCGAGLACCDLACRPDPCLTATCPKDTTCHADPFHCGVTCTPIPMEARDQIVGAGGAFACAIGPRAGSPRALLLLLGLVLLGYRRRRCHRR
jgi:MYXO-CTERM domain-containing protein